MIQKYVIGIDISKSKIDCAVLCSEYDVVLEKEVLNTEAKIKKFINSVMKTQKVTISDMLVCCENTGIF